MTLRDGKQIFVLSALILAALVGGVLYLCNGNFQYAVDDVYIHLAVATQLPFMGAIAGIPAATSSSILYPWLLVPFASFKYAPFIINLAALAGCLWVLHRILLQLGLYNLYPRAYTGALAVLLAFLCNFFAFPFFGLEHGLHALATLAVLSAFIDLDSGKPLPRWFWPVLIILPAIRYEGLAMFGVAIVLLLTVPGQRKAALLALAAEAALQAGYAAYLHAQGLPFIPGSLLIKTQIVTFSVYLSLLSRPLTNLQNPQGGMILYSVTYLLVLCHKYLNMPALLVAGTLGAHLLAAPITDTTYRYYIYLLPLAPLGLAYTLRHDLAEFKTMPAHRLLGLLALSLATCGAFSQTLTLPRAGQNLYLQQQQFTRFVQDYWQDSVAANDIGLVSWKNPHAVYDLYGLGSEEMRQLRKSGPHGLWAPATMDAYLRRHHVGLAIIYEAWFENERPQNWTRVARLSFNRPAVSASDNEVSFFLTDPAQEEKLRNALRRWAPTLPPAAILEMFPPEQ